MTIYSMCDLQEPPADLRNEERSQTPKPPPPSEPPKHPPLEPPTTPASNKKSRLRSGAKRKLLRTPKRVKLTIAEDSGSDAIVDVNNPEAAASSGSGGQWTVAEVSESPRGEIKMKINRGQSGRSSAAGSPVTASASATPVPSPVQRLSRRMVQEIGMSPGKLNKMLLGSPSPSRKRPREEVSVLIGLR